MQTLKEQSIDAISQLPDDASIDDIMYRLYVLEKIKKGEDAIRDGKYLGIEDLKKEMATW